MMSPVYFREARMTAAHHILARIVRRDGGRIGVRVVRVYRGDLKRGAKLTLIVSIRPEYDRDHPPQPSATLYTPGEVVRTARYAEAFLDGAPPEVVRDQIRFHRFSWTAGRGDPDQDTFLW
jgi:hypothetical protein